VCTSYFCKSNQGQRGLNLWRDVESYLNLFEWVLAREVLLRLGLGENELAYSRDSVGRETDESERSYFIESA
jgi:hypothetical protein